MNTFITNPTKKTLWIFGTLWLIGFSLLTLAMTDLFQESFFQKKYTVIYLILFGNTFYVLRLFRTYYKNKNASN